MGLFPKTDETNETPASPQQGEREPDVPMPVGVQLAKVVHVVPGITSTGKVRFGVKYEDNQGRTAWGNIVAPDGSNPKHTRFFYSTMAKFQVGQKYLDDDATTPESVAEAMLGSTILVTVDDEKYKGKVYRKVTWVDEAPAF